MTSSARATKGLGLSEPLVAILQSGRVLATIFLRAKETRKGKECYDAVVNWNGKEMAIRVDADGKFLGAHPETAEKKEKSKSY